MAAHSEKDLTRQELAFAPDDPQCCGEPIRSGAMALAFRIVTVKRFQPSRSALRSARRAISMPVAYSPKSNFSRREAARPPSAHSILAKNVATRTPQRHCGKGISQKTTMVGFL